MKQDLITFRLNPTIRPVIEAIAEKFNGGNFNGTFNLILLNYFNKMSQKAIEVFLINMAFQFRGETGKDPLEHHEEFKKYYEEHRKNTSDKSLIVNGILNDLQDNDREPLPWI